MSELIVGGVKVTYHVAGSGPVCLVHPGGPGIHYEYLRMPELEQHLTMVYVEPVGTGNSDLLPDGDYSMENYAYYANEVARQLGEEKVFFLGHSHGGFVALQFALDHPESLAGIIVYDSMAFNGPELGEEAGRRVDEYAAEHAGDPLADQVVQAWREDADLPADKAAHLDSLGRLLPVYFKDFRGIQDRIADWMTAMDLTLDPNRQPSLWDVRNRLGEITVPTLVLVGVADFICGEKWARQLHDGIPGSQLVVFGESGHFAHLEEPEAFSAAVLGFSSAH
ncbi:alpha/beta fold hydrolase [Kribbella qitaiheensis]|uniref:alpha/beta fold hydrolase n=1 Tax=Kribbella qitaiheensis TaxID=1544730 RepID=UPI00360B9C9F